VKLKVTILVGLFFGAGFLCGFLSGYKYAGAIIVCELPPVFREISREGPVGLSEDLKESVKIGVSETASNETEATGDIGLTIEEHWMDSDDGGLFIAGIVKNSGLQEFDAVRIAFDLLDERGLAYSAVTDINDGGMEPGASWDFTIYIPYAEMDKLKSYRLQSIMGVKSGRG
jgi:hypothetical protein